MTFPPDTLERELVDHLWSTFLGYSGDMKRANWVMSREWLNEVRKVADATGPLTNEIMLMGLLVTVRDDGGVPHLEHVWPALQALPA